MDCSIIKKIILFLFIFTTAASSIEFQGEFFQGHFILGKTNSGAEILIDKKKINVSEDGYFVFGIEGLTKGMGVELAKNNIRVNTVAPTFVATPMVKNFFKNKKFKKSALDRIPMGKLATESDVATTVCFLASSASSMITGTSILIDGGWTAQ